MTKKMPGPRPNDLISVPKAAAMCHCSRTAVYRWIFTGKIRGWRRGATRWFVSESEILATFRAFGAGFEDEEADQPPPVTYAENNWLPS